MKKKLFKKLLLLIVMMSGNVFLGQEIVKGKVESAGLPLPGVNVVIKGSSVGTTTDFDGTFVLKNVPPNSKLVVTYIGYAAREVVADSKSFMMINLAGDTKALTEIVVVGYGTAKKKDVTGAVSSVTAKDLKDQPFTGLDQALQGRVSGVSVTQNSGTPGGGVSIRIRGIASLSGNEPLYVIDGVPIGGGDNNDSFAFNTISGANGQTKISALSELNPADIESMDILKDASAAAIYGSRASNGVVLITTKKGKKGKSTISYETYGGIQEASKFLDVLDLKGYAKYQSDYYKLINQPVPYEYQNPEFLGEGTNWQKEIFRAAKITNHQLSISGGKDNTRYYTSLNYFDQDGIVVNSGFKRYSMRLNLDTKINDWFKIGNNLTLSNARQQITFNDTEDGVINTALTQSPNVPVRYSDGSYGGPLENFGAGTNPVALSEIKNNGISRYKLNGSLFGEISLSKSLSFKTVLGYDYTTSDASIFIPDTKIGNSSSSSLSDKQKSTTFFWTLQNYFNYNKSIGKSTFGLLLGQEAQQSKFEGLSGRVTGFTSNLVDNLGSGDAKTATNGSYRGTSSISSYYTRVNYSYDDKYLLTATYRMDSSSKFAPGKRTGYFPSFSAAWVLSNESFFKNIEKTINLIKFRGGYGEVGNQNIGDYKFGAVVTSFPTPLGIGFAQSNIQNPNVTWETTKATNFGLELGLFSNAIKLEVDVYKKISSDFLFQKPVPAYLGTNPQQDNLGLAAPFVNLGDIENKGIDITLNTRNLSKGNLNWNTTFIFSKFTNKLTSFDEDNGSIVRLYPFSSVLTKTSVGQPLGQFFGYITDGLYRSQEDLDAVKPDKAAVIGDIRFKDLNGDNKITDDDKTFIGSPIPDFTYSIINNLSYKNFDLALVLLGSQGNKIYNWSRSLTEGLVNPFANQSAVANDRFIKGENENTDIPRFDQFKVNDNARVSSRFVEDGSYLRIQNLTLGYSFSPNFLTKSKFFSKVRLYSTVQNLHTFTKYKGLDPAVGSLSQDALLTGIDNGRYPVARVYTFGINLDF
jgi:TonB-dependent starch-binding outer membrane protein SusC